MNSRQPMETALSDGAPSEEHPLLEAIRTSACTSIYYVAGNIGVGKSTLLEYLRQNGIAISPEHVSGISLSEFITPGSTGTLEAPMKFASPFFQAEMMLMSFIRSVIPANVPLNEYFRRNEVVFSERGWIENIVFAKANLEMGGGMTEDFYGDYVKKVKIFMFEHRELIKKPTVVLFLWAYQKICIRRIQKRGRAGEENYDSSYMEMLNHCYLMMILLSNVKRGIPFIPKFEVVNWADSHSENSSGLVSRITSFGSSQIRIGTERPSLACSTDGMVDVTFDLDEYLAAFRENPDSVVQRRDNLFALLSDLRQFVFVRASAASQHFLYTFFDAKGSNPESFSHYKEA